MYEGNTIGVYYKSLLHWGYQKQFEKIQNHFFLCYNQWNKY